MVNHRSRNFVNTGMSKEWDQFVPEELTSVKLRMQETQIDEGQAIGMIGREQQHEV